MQTENQSDEVPLDINQKPRPKVTYLETPIKSENDQKEYRVIQLENGLTALLIADVHSLASQSDEEDKDRVNIILNENEDDETGSQQDDDDDDDDDDYEDEDDDDDADDDDDNSTEDDHSDREDASARTKRSKQEEKMAACGLCVGVGSFSDPPEIPGLAHFLEHMVFMGSEKYPQENDFDAFIKKRGGSDNASTECQLTTFYFEIQEKYLLSALDRFAQFFIKPLMKKDAITREREAVESEFQMALPSDIYRKEQLFCSFARSDHPATKFTWGNLVTLRDNVTDEKLYEELHKFRERHYSAHRMKVTIQARLSLDTLEDYVIQCFANVPSNNLPPDDFTPYIGANSFDTPNFRRIYKIKPINDVCQVELTWVMPPLHDLYKSKPHQYVSWVIGHEGKGSLISYLRNKMWCLDVYSGNEGSGFEHSSMYALFSVLLMLTEEGEKHLKEVLNAVFSYINLLRREGPLQRIYDELHQIEETNFRFADEVPPAEYVEDLCENMHYYPPRDYIAGSEMYFEYNPEAIRDCINYLAPDNVNIIIFDKKFNDEKFDKVEPWFKTKYTDVEIPEIWTEHWKTVEPLPEFHLPLPNVFLTDDFTLIPIPPNVPKYPKKIYSDDITEIWYRPDPKFRLPECYMCFYILLPCTLHSSRSAAMTDLFVAILKQLLVEELYPATVVELNHEIYTRDRGIVINVNGYNQKLPLLLNTIAKCIADSSTLITEKLFQVMKEEQIKEYYNTFLKPKKLVKEVRLSIIMHVYWTSVERHLGISDVEFDEFLVFVKSLMKQVYIQCLVQGNMTKEDVIKNMREFVTMLECGKLHPETIPQIKIAQIPIGSQYCKVKNFNRNDVNSVVTNYYQSGKASVKLSVILQLMMIMMKEPLFNTLRTQEQLGYDVFCLLRNPFGVLGYSITVYTQADKYSTEHVDSRIEAFVESFNKILSEMSEKDLGCIKETLTMLKKCADIHLNEEVSRNWAEIVGCEYMFDRIENELNTIEHITIDELKEWMVSHSVDGSNFRKLSVHVIGTSKPADKEGNADLPPNKFQIESVETETEDKSSVYITDIQEYKTNLQFYN